MNKFDYKNLTPFKWFVLENFPFIEADFDALTEWQLFCKLGKEMNKIINSENTLGAQVETLTDYVSNYFDNLDVQDEINNKLNEMTESGELQEIIEQFLNSNSLLCFNTVNDMKNSENLINGCFVTTFGFYEINDGGGALYKIRNINNNDVVDNMFIIPILENSLIAELIFNGEVLVNSCGVYGDGIHDDYSKLNELITKAKNKNCKLKFNSNSTYLLSQGIDVSNLYVDFNNSKIRGYGTNTKEALIIVNSEEYYTTFENINLDCTNVNNGINLIQARKCYITNVNIINIKSVGIRYTGGYEVKINHVNLTGDGVSECYGMYNYGHDGAFTDVVLIDCYIGVFNHGFNIYNDIHGWIYSEELYYHSCFFNIELNPIIATNIYSDTYHWVICSESDIAECVFTNLYSLTSERALTIEKLQGEPISLHHGKSAQYNARYINIKNSIIQAPSFGINWNTNNENQVLDFAGVIDARFPSNINNYLQGIPNSPSITLPNKLEKTTELVNLNMDTVDINCFYKILTPAQSYQLTLPFFVKPCRLLVYETSQWDSAELVGIAYFNNNTCSISINSQHTLTTNKYLYMCGVLPRIYRTNS